MTTFLVRIGLIFTATTAFAGMSGGNATSTSAAPKNAHQTRAVRVPTPSNPCPTKFPLIDSSCQKICQACFEAKYVVGEVGIGDGFWADCVEPLVMNRPAPKHPTSDGQELPTLPTGLSDVAATCKQKSGNFWKKK